ncbi:MAG: hypothetical protein Q8P50_12270 [Bacillota bacterium]|nr:hypothetical protein [Bacillota bacterium]
MESGSATLTYLIAEPFESALKSVRQVLAKEDLRVPLELDVTVRIRKELGLSLAPCRVLFVDCPVLLLEAVTLDSSVAAILPLHVALAGYGPQTRVHLISSSVAFNLSLPPAPSAAVGKLQTRVVRALEKIASRQAVCELVP